MVAASRGAYSIGTSTFAIDRNGRLLGWGDDSSGQLGLGRQTIVPTPIRIGDGFKIVSVR